MLAWNVRSAVTPPYAFAPGSTDRTSNSNEGNVAIVAVLHPRATIELFPVAGADPGRRNTVFPRVNPSGTDSDAPVGKVPVKHSANVQVLSFAPVAFGAKLNPTTLNENPHLTCVKSAMTLLGCTDCNAIEIVPAGASAVPGDAVFTCP